jgi:hypothetical protein
MFIKNGSFKKITHIISYVQPKIYIQPVGGTINVGNNYTFFINARGSIELTYQWYKNNFPLFGETKNSLTITNAQISDTSNYYCSVTNKNNTIQSDAAQLNVVTV